MADEKTPSTSTKASTKKIKKKKKWLSLLASKEFKEQKIGETMSYEPEQAIGRTIRVSLGALTGDMKRQSKIVTFRIKEIQGSNAFTDLVDYELTQMHIKRFIRKERQRVDDSFQAQTKEGTKIQLKTFMLARVKMQHSLHTSLRKSARDFLSKIAGEKNYSEFAIELMSGNLQKEMKMVLKKLYPLQVAEIRQMRKL